MSNYIQPPRASTDFHFSFAFQSLFIHFSFAFHLRKRRKEEKKRENTNTDAPLITLIRDAPRRPAPTGGGKFLNFAKFARQKKKMNAVTFLIWAVYSKAVTFDMGCLLESFLSLLPPICLFSHIFIYCLFSHILHTEGSLVCSYTHTSYMIHTVVSRTTGFRKCAGSAVCREHRNTETQREREDAETRAFATVSESPHTHTSSPIGPGRPRCRPAGNGNNDGFTRTAMSSHARQCLDTHGGQRQAGSAEGSGVGQGKRSEGRLRCGAMALARQVNTGGSRLFKYNTTYCSNVHSFLVT
jgi:hypothetical protein